MAKAAAAEAQRAITKAIRRRGLLDEDMELPRD
jgi:hypothetical protein